MNRKQKIIIGVGLGLILLSGLFPAYEGEFRVAGGISKKYLGYYFLFSQPNTIDIAKAFPAGRAGYDENIRFNANIIVSHFFIQIVTLLLLTIGFVFLFADPKRDKNGK